MDKKMIDIIKNEKEIPDEVMEKITRNREDILNRKIKQEQRIFKQNRKKKIALTVLVAAIAGLILVTKTPIGSAIENVFGVSRDSGVQTVESQGIQTKLDLTSIQNGREIKLTKFVSTKKKFAFDYQFKLDDEKLKELLKKQSSPDRQFKKLATNYQDIEIGLFADGDKEDIRGGGVYESSFRVDGDTFYGSVVATLNRDDIPEDANLTLHIYKLNWQDADELDQAFIEASLTDSSFSVSNALEYTGDWTFEIDYKPLTQTADTEVTNINNLENIRISNDALQTTAKFTFSNPEIFSFEAGVGKTPGIDIYKDGVKIDISSFVFDFETGEFTVSFDLSAVDKTSTYKIQLSDVDEFDGHTLSELGSFELKNK